MPAIQISGLNKTFGRSNRALRNIGIQIMKGEMVALIGASGSGKSTLLRHISGLITADSGAAGGDIKVLGRTMQSGGKISRDARLMRAKVGVVFQQFNLVSRLTVLTNVLTGLLGQISGVRGTFGFFSRSEKIAAMRALARVGIAETASQRASTLSGGQQQRAAIARVLLQGAEIICADEPIASLDPVSSKRVMEALLEINKSDGKTVIVSLHQVDFAMRYCPRIVALKDGAVVYDGPSAALSPEILNNLYGAESDDAPGYQPVESQKPPAIYMPPQPVEPIAATA